MPLARLAQNTFHIWSCFFEFFCRLRAAPQKFSSIGYIFKPIYRKPFIFEIANDYILRTLITAELLATKVEDVWVLTNLDSLSSWLRVCRSRNDYKFTLKLRTSENFRWILMLKLFRWTWSKIRKILLFSERFCFLVFLFGVDKLLYSAFFGVFWKLVSKVDFFQFQKFLLFAWQNWKFRDFPTKSKLSFRWSFFSGPL